MKQQHNAALQRADRVLEEYMRGFCREMIRIGLFRDGLDEALNTVRKDMGNAMKALGAADTKPEDRITKANEQLKNVEKMLASIAQRYSKHAAAMNKVGQIGTTDQAIRVVNSHLAYFYLARTGELMGRARSGDQRALAEARSCRMRIGQLDPKLAANLDKNYPELAPRRPGAPATAPTTKPAP
jgi:hypothetical protein